MIEVALKTRKHLADLLGAAEVGDGVGDGVVVAQPKKWGEFVLVEFLDADLDVLGQHEVEKGLLLGIEIGVDGDFGVGGPLFASEVMGVWDHARSGTHFGINRASNGSASAFFRGGIVVCLGGHPKPAIGGHLRTGQ